MAQPEVAVPKPYWTAARIMAVVLTVLVVASASIAGLYYYGFRPPSGTPNLECSNGATNYPSCNVCPSNQYYDSATGKCSSGDFAMTATQPAFSPVGSSATSAITVTAVGGFTGVVTITAAIPGSIPLGFSCPSAVTPSTITGSGTATITCFSLVVASPYMTITGVSGSLSHMVGISWNFFQNTCSNGATNYPQCNIFDSTTVITCTPTSIETHALTSASCHVVVASVQAPTVPTGSVGFTASGTDAWYANGAPCTLILATGYAYCDITGVSTSGPSGTMTIHAGYGGDATHASSTGSFSLTVVNPPSTVTVSGTASTVGLGTTANQINFIDTATGLTYSTLINSGSYSINLGNLKTYTVTINYSYFGGSGTCNTGTLNLQSSTTTWTADYSC